MWPCNLRSKRLNNIGHVVLENAEGARSAREEPASRVPEQLTPYITQALATQAMPCGLNTMRSIVRILELTS